MQALRECFPDKFQGMYDQSEIETGEQPLPEAEVAQYISRAQQKELFKLADAETVKRALDTLGYTKTSEIKVSEFEGFKDLLADLAEKVIEVEAEEAVDELEKIGDEIEM